MKIMIYTLENGTLLAMYVNQYIYKTYVVLATKIGGTTNAHLYFLIQHARFIASHTLYFVAVVISTVIINFWN